MKSYIKEKEKLVGYELRSVTSGKAVGMVHDEKSAIRLASKFEEDGIKCKIYRITELIVRVEC